LVSDGKSDRESEGDPICMQIGWRIGFKNLRVDGPLVTQDHNLAGKTKKEQKKKKLGDLCMKKLRTVL
jgi:hypothetical protein